MCQVFSVRNCVELRRRDLDKYEFDDADGYRKQQRHEDGNMDILYFSLLPRFNVNISQLQFEFHDLSIFVYIHDASSNARWTVTGVHYTSHGLCRSFGV